MTPYNKDVVEAIAALHRLFSDKADTSAPSPPEAHASGHFAALTEMLGASGESVHQSIFDSINAVFYVVDKNLRVLTWNRQFERVTARSAEAIRDTQLLEYIHPSNWQVVIETTARAIRSAAQETTDVLFVPGDDTVVPMVMTLTAVMRGDRWFIFGWGIDNTEAKSAQRRLQWHAEFQHLLVVVASELLSLPPESGPMGLEQALVQITQFLKVDRASIYYLEESGKLKCLAQWNTTADTPSQALVEGLPADRFPRFYAALNAGEVITVEDTGAYVLEESLSGVIQGLGPKTFVLIPMLAKNQLFGFVSIGANQPRQWRPEETANLKVAGQLIANAVVRFQDDLRLKRREAELDATLEASQDGILVLDTDGNTIHANHRFAEIWNLEIPPAPGTAINDLRKTLSRLAPKAFGDTWQSCGLQVSGANPEQCWTLTDGRKVEIHSRPFKREEGVNGRVCAFRDVTARHQLETELRQAQKMESVGRLASGIAHDFNNILFIISSICDVLSLSPDLKKQELEDISRIKNASERAATLTRQLLAFSRKQVLSMSLVRVNDIAKSMSLMLPRLIGEDIELRFSIRSQQDRVKADANQLEQILMNLAVNSRDAMPEGGRLLIETDDARIEEAWTHQNQTILPSSYVLLSISDTGSGMDEETVRQIYDPFFTTKQVGKGSGLGLAMVYGIVKQHNGFIFVESAPGEGTTFRILLPLADDAPPAPHPDKLKEGNGETVLVVEDDVTARKMAIRMLKTQHYNVLTAANGEEALALAKQYEDPIHLLLTDVIMPVMGGRKLYEELLQIRPDIRVIYMSGYTTHEVEGHGMLKDGINFLQKPFSMRSLFATIRNVLDS